MQSTLFHRPSAALIKPSSFSPTMVDIRSKPGEIASMKPEINSELQKLKKILVSAVSAAKGDEALLGKIITVLDNTLRKLSKNPNLNKTNKADARSPGSKNS